MGRSLARRPKKTRKAKSMKRVWELRRSVKEPNIFDDVLPLPSREEFANATSSSRSDMSMNDISESDDDQADDQQDVQGAHSNDDEPLEAKSLISRNPRWCSTTYPVRFPVKNNCSKPSFTASGIICSDEYDEIMEQPLPCEPGPTTVGPILGKRIVDLGYVLSWSIGLQYNHSKMCTCGTLYVDKEKRKNKGLVSTIVFKCTMCSNIYEYDTENPTKTVSDINNGAVWGTLASGESFSHMEELFSCMDIPCMPDNMFYSIENDIGKEWRTSLWKSMEDAGIRERQHAIEVGNVCPDGVPWVTVYLDGSWSKRSYGSNYNSLSGMVGIVGRFTNQLLFVGVRNKFCSICTRAENNSQEARDHTCYKNWSDSAPAMESDLAVEGFALSETMHGIRYTQFIADGDASVFAKIKERVPYGQSVRKIECTNHALKNYGKNLRKVKADTHINLNGRKLITLQKIKLLTKRAKCSIYEHSKREVRDMELFRNDLKNSIHHVFGDHSECREGICNTPGDVSANKVPELKATRIFDHIYGALNLLLRKAHLLIENENNNAAERLMNIVARCNMGKRLNLIQRGSYERRVHLAGLRYNKSFKWHSSPWKKLTGRSPGAHFKKFMERQVAKSEAPCRKKLFVDTTATPKRTKNPKGQKKPKVKNTDYGVNAEDVNEEDENFIEMEAQLLMERLKVTKEERNTIQHLSVGQFGNHVYEDERRKRLTASLFGRIIKRKPHTPCHNMVKTCLQPTVFHTEATEYGISKEPVAIKLFEKMKNTKVNPSGLWIHEDFGFLAASPDGLIGDDAVVEVKCIYAPNKVFGNLEELVKLLKSKTFLKVVDGEVQLNRRHAYYHQIQGQLNITDRRKCYLVVYVNDDIPVFVEEIVKDALFWEAKMLPILAQFYKECIAPEIIRENLRRNLKCIDPPYILDAIKVYEEKKKNKLSKS